MRIMLGASQVVLMVNNPPANIGDARDPGSIPGSGRSPGVGNGNTFQDSCLKNLMDRGAWGTTVHRVTKNQTRHIIVSSFGLLQIKLLWA